MLKFRWPPLEDRSRALRAIGNWLNLQFQRVRAWAPVVALRALLWVSGSARKGGRLLLALLALGAIFLVIGLILMSLPSSLAHVSLVASVGLTSAAVATALLRHNAHLGEVGGYSGLEALGQKLERGIEELKDLQWQLSDNESRYRDLLDNQPDVIARRDASGRLSFVNRAFCRTFGVEAGAVLGTTFQPEVLERDEASGEKDTPGLRNQSELLVTTVDGPRWFAFTDQATSGDSSEDGELQSHGRDVTEQRRALAKLSEARDEAEAANRAKSRFLAAMSHEIRTPMNGILGMTSLLGETELSPEQRSYTSAVDLSAKNLLTIIDEILDLSKIEAGKLEIHPAPFRLDQCVQSVVELMAPRAREKALELAWRIDPALPTHIIGDETRVRQILLNLVGNAVKFTDQGGVTVRVCRAEAASAGEADGPQALIEMTVADSGPGIAQSQISALFSEFQQADDIVRRKRGGSGLGLAISRRLARAMGGDVTVASEPGRGSTFVARMAFEADESRHHGASPSINADGRCVLVVSARAMQRAIMGEILRSYGVAAEVAHSPAAAEALLRDAQGGRRFDCLVADSEIGTDFVGHLIGLLKTPARPEPRAVLVVDQPGGGHLEAFREAGCNAYLVRPVRPSSLLIQLDLDKRLPADKLPEPPTPNADDRGHRKVLLVEDNDINALLARRMSERAGCDVHHAASGPAALDHCEVLLADPAASVDLVLMDIHMPEMDGFETARRIKRLFAARGRNAPPIVALTANAFAEDRKRCMEAGLDDYLAKPFERAELEALLEKWCHAGPSTRDGRLGDAAA